VGGSAWGHQSLTTSNLFPCRQSVDNLEVPLSTSLNMIAHLNHQASYMEAIAASSPDHLSFTGQLTVNAPVSQRNFSMSPMETC
jgi:hypothetical protein